MQEKCTVTIKVEGGKEFTQSRNVVAKIDTDLCVNCGMCRNSCPTDAIWEYQRDICRLCPDCADGPEQFPEESKRYATEHACSLACPLGTVPEGYVNLIAQGRLKEAYDVLRFLNPFPSVCAMICHHPCEDECKRGLLIDKPIAIRALKRYATGAIDAPPLKYNRNMDIKVAVIGAGPAGLTAAADLSAKGYRVKIFEAGPEPGGMMRKGIPDFRIDKEALSEEIRRLLDAGIEIENNCIVGKKPAIGELLDENYAAVLIAVGAHRGSLLPLPGVQAEKVYDAVNFMHKVNSDTPVPLGKKAIVIGGGSVAMDTARTLRRLGVKQVACAFIESFHCEGERDVVAPAPVWEIEEAREEGIEMFEKAMPVRIVAEWFTVKGVEFKKVSCIEINQDDIVKPIGIDDSEFIVEADTVIFATGQKANTRFLAEGGNLKVNDDGRIFYDVDTLATSNELVFIAGDAAVARGSVIDAMAAGRKAALSIDNMIMGRCLEDGVDRREPRLGPPEEKIYPATHLEKLNHQVVPKDRFRDSFDMVEKIFDDTSAILEARRCMKCGYSGVEQDNCIGCGVCASLCPVKAISLVKVQ